MRSKWMARASVLVVLVLALILVQGAGAGNFHFKSTSLNLGSLVFNGELVGLGNEAAEVTLTGYGTVKALCQNKGGQQAPGRNPITADVQQTRVFVTDSNGLALVEVTAQDPTLADLEPSPKPKEAGCPNGNWQVIGTVDRSTDWKKATVEVKDETGQVQIFLSFTCTTSFQNGVSTGITCQET